jgi:hypothetical protein
MTDPSSHSAARLPPARLRPGQRLALALVTVLWCLLLVLLLIHAGRR